MPKWIFLLSGLLFILIVPISVANTAVLPGSYDPDPNDLITLMDSTSERIITYDVSAFQGDQIEFVVRYANLDALNLAFGDSVEIGSFSLLSALQEIISIDNVFSGEFAETAADVGAYVIDGHLQLSLALGQDSDPLIFYQPWLQVTDSINPGVTNDLLVISTYPSTLVLGWTAPGDDGSIGNAALYDIRYSNIPVEIDTISWWNSAIQAENIPEPSSPGETDTCFVNDLEISTTYYFVLITYDELGNQSSYSNIAEGTTPDETPPNYCLLYDGDDLVDFPFYEAFNTGAQLTVEAWFNLDSSYTWNHARILDKPSGTNAPPFYQYSFGPANHTDFFAHIAVDSSYWPFELYQVVIPNIWMHAAMTYDGINKTVYLNGNLIAQEAAEGEILAYETGVRVGCLKDFFDCFFKGKIDDIRIWNVSRTQQQIQNFMYQPLHGDEQGLAVYWNFDEGGGQLVHDRSANNCDGNLGLSEDIETMDPIWIESDVPFGHSMAEPGQGVESGHSNAEIITRAYPNAFNDRTNVTFNLPRETRIHIEIFDMLGRHVKTLVDDHYESGSYQVAWDGRSDFGESLSSGVYLYRLTADGADISKKLVMLK